jgi:SAM-dependent methyltransferase
VAGIDLRALLHHGSTPADWQNLGLWPAPHEAQPDYAGACRALAMAVGAAAEIQPGDRVLSVACGAGEELDLWTSAFGAAEAIGLEPDAGACAQAARRGRTVIHGGLAQTPTTPFHRVICVDAAYHISPRRDLIQAARRALLPGGTLAFTDLVADRPMNAAMRAAARACRIDPHELVDTDTAAARITAAGFTDVRYERLDASVLEGFRHFAALQSRRIGMRRWHTSWWPAAVTARLLLPARARGLGYALFSGRATGQAPRQPSTACATLT